MNNSSTKFHNYFNSTCHQLSCSQEMQTRMELFLRGLCTFCPSVECMKQLVLTLRWGGDGQTELVFEHPSWTPFWIARDLFIGFTNSPPVAISPQASAFEKKVSWSRSFGLSHVRLLQKFLRSWELTRVPARATSRRPTERSRAVIQRNSRRSTEPMWYWEIHQKEKLIFLTGKKFKMAQAKEQRKKDNQDRKAFLEAKAKKGARKAGWQGARSTVNTETHRSRRSARASAQASHHAPVGAVILAPCCRRRQ